jgi:actin-like ATPase involved in cell morphogenesis
MTKARRFGTPQFCFRSESVTYAIRCRLVKTDATVIQVLEMAPLELYRDIVRKEGCLAGGGGLLKGFDKGVSDKNKYSVHDRRGPAAGRGRRTGIALKSTQMEDQEQRYATSSG